MQKDIPTTGVETDADATLNGTDRLAKLPANHDLPKGSGDAVAAPGSDAAAVASSTTEHSTTYLHVMW